MYGRHDAFISTTIRCNVASSHYKLRDYENDLLIASDSDSISILTLLDLSAAFDTTDHSTLLTRLESTFGVRELALSFFRSYLQDRTQVVTVNEIKSSPLLLTCEVPQDLNLFLM